MFNSVCAIGEEWVSALVLICIFTPGVAAAMICTVIDAIEYHDTVVPALLQLCVCFLSYFVMLVVSQCSFD